MSRQQEIEWEHRAKISSGKIKQIIPLVPPSSDIIKEPTHINLPRRPPSLNPFHDIKVQQPTPILNISRNTDDVKNWCVSTHIFPASWPRSTIRSVQSRSNKFETQHNKLGKSKDKKSLLNDAKKFLNLQQKDLDIDISNESTYKDQELLWIVANRYYRPKNSSKPKSNSNNYNNGYTLVTSHAAGMHKETYEPLLANCLSSGSASLIDEIWSLDTYNNGDSFLLNKEKLGDSLRFEDVGRDIANFILHYLPSNYTESQELPYVLKRQQPQEVAKSRQIIGIGHSIGGGALAHAAYAAPFIFSSLIFLDPCIPPLREQGRSTVAQIASCLRRDQSWDSFENAHEIFRLWKTFSGKWDEDVLRRYVYCGLYQVAEKRVHLKSSKYEEAQVWASSTYIPYEHAHEIRLSTLPINLRRRTLLVHPDINCSIFQESSLQDIVDAIGVCKRERVFSTGHLMVQEKPQECAQIVARHLAYLSQESKL